MALLTGMTEDGREVPVQVDGTGRLVAEGLIGPAGPAGPTGPIGPVGDPSIFKPGTAQAPGLSPVGYPGTGLSASAGGLSVSTSGIERIKVVADGHVEIGRTSDSLVSTIHGDLELQRFDSGVGRRFKFFTRSNGGHLGTLDWYDLAANNFIKASIRAYSKTGSNQSGLSFSTADGSYHAVERLFITPKGDLELGSSSKISAVGIVSAVHADNAAARAAGLAAGDIYRKADGTLMIAF